MYLKQLRYFAKIVELNNMTAASVALHVSQSSLSHHIANLELHLGVKLLVREARGVQCTPAGGVLYEHAKVVLKQIERAETAVRNLGGSQPEIVTLGMPRSEAPLIAPHLLERLAQERPDLTLTIVEDSPDALTELMGQGKIDVALLADARGDAGYDELHVLTEDMLLVGPAAPDQEPMLPVSEFAEHPFILPRAPSSIRTKVDRLCKELAIPYRVVAEAASIAVALQCVKAGICWTVLPWAALARAETDYGIGYWEIEGAPLKRDLFVCIARNAAAQPAANAVRTLLVEMARSMVRRKEWRYASLAPEVAPADAKNAGALAD